MFLINKLPLKVACCAGMLMGLCSTSHAVSSVSLEFGSGNRTKLARVGVQWAWERQWWKSNGTHVGGYWDASLARWRNTRFQDRPGSTQHITGFGITPVFRLQQDDLTGLYGEAGIGVRYLSDLYDNNGHQLSTKFQFASHLGVGYVFQNSVDLGLRVQHISNGSIKKPNSGVDFVVVRASYRF